MTVSLYQTGVSGLLAAQQQLGTTGNNIANVNTEGYNRQRAEQSAAIGISNGSNFLGSGTYVDDITRIYNKFSYKEQIINQSNLGNANSLNNSLNQLNDIMSFSGSALSSSLNQFYQAINGIADTPNDLGLRSIALNQAEALSSDFRTLNDNFDQLEKSVNGEIEQVARKISEISLSIASLNETILKSQNTSVTGQPNDLLDRRDQLVNELSQYTKVSTIEDKNGVMTVMIGPGTTLVAGITPLTVVVESGNPDPMKTQLALVSSNSKVAIDGSKLGGALAASIEFRDENLAQIRNEINRLAITVSSTFNESQSKGLDLNKTQGANIFSDINSTILQESRVLSPTTNAGTLTAKVNISDVTLLPADEFRIKFDGTDYIMTNSRTNASVNIGAPGSGTPAGTIATPFGFEFIETGGAPATNDTFVIRPGESSAALMQVTLTDKTAIAASSAVAVTASDHNISSGSVDVINTIDPEAAMNYTNTINNGLTVDVYESPANTFNYRIYNSDTPPPAATIATGTYPSGGSAIVDLPPSPGTAAFQIEIKGNLSGLSSTAREQFTINESYGVGNSGNAVAMALTQEKGIINNGKETFSQNLGVATSIVGANASSADLNADTAQALYTQAYNRNQSTSGVNLDEEAANLLKFQQAYQAASQVISVANTIFDTILSAVR